MAFITPGDVLAQMMEWLELEKPDFDLTLTNFLEKELLSDQFANLEQAGHTTSDRIPIARVFTDLPTYSESLLEPPAEESSDHLPPGFVADVLATASERLNPLMTASVPDEANKQTMSSKLGRTVLIGGPGQGKTTIGQFCCQLFRAALLKDRPSHLITPPSKDVLKGIVSFCEGEGIDLPLARRFPLRIELSALASALASKEKTGVTSLLSFLTMLIGKRTNLDVSPKDFRQWLRDYPWVIILDGLDEVPSSTNRQEVLAAIQDFWVDATQLDADILVIATTRPQGYNDDFSPRYYEHRWLAPLSNVRALHYGELLAQARYGNDPDRCGRIVARLRRASGHEATARVMRSPLQVTIMATLVDRMGSPPQERWQLFKAYYDIIYQREVERDIPPATILRNYRSDIDAIHSIVGLLLQIESERAGGTEAQLSAHKFAAVVHDRLASEGHEGSELEDLKHKIIEAATNRLVFLVGLQANKIGFEIRSLQEFMASEALMDGTDEIVKQRLREISTIANWRNVFLFAAGKCFAVQQALRDTIATIASQLNDDPEDEVAQLTLAGSRLCLDLLEDGPARRQPKYARILARTALRILHLPPDDSQRRLAALYEPQFEGIFEEEISRNLEQIFPQQRLGSWVCLLNLVEARIGWADVLSHKYWPDSNEIYDLIDLLQFVGFRNKRKSSLFQRIAKIFPSLSPIRLYQLFVDNRPLLRILGQKSEPWITAITELLSLHDQVGANRVQSTIAHLILFSMSILRRTDDGAVPDLSGEKFQRLCENAKADGHRIWVDSLEAVLLPNPLTEEWVSAIDYIGRQDGLGIGDNHEPLVKRVHDAFLRDDSKIGLLRLLAVFAIGGNVPPIPMELIDPAKYDEQRYREAATILTLAQYSPSPDQIAAISRFTASLLENHPEVDLWSLTKPNEHRMRGSQMNQFLIALMGDLDPVNWISRQQIIRSLQDSLATRTTALDEPQNWNSLNLPEGLGDIFATGTLSA